MILDTNALSAYLDRTPEAVEIVSRVREAAEGGVIVIERRG